MAGESPGAKRHQQQKKTGRREIPFNEQRSSDKYYKSKQKSVIGTTMSDRKGRPGDPVKPIPTPKLGRSSDIPTTADKKYYAPQPQAPTVQQIQAEARKRSKLPGKASKLPSKLPRGISAHDELRIDSREDVQPVMDALLERLDGTPITVYLSSKKLSMRARTALDLMVTREQISEDQARDVQFTVVESVAAQTVPSFDFSAPPPMPSETVSADADDDEGFCVDPLDVLSGKVNLDDEKIDTTPHDVTVVDDSVDPPEEEAADDDDDDDDDDAPAEEAATDDDVAASILDPEQAVKLDEPPVMPIRETVAETEDAPSETEQGDMESSGAINVIGTEPEPEETAKPRRRSKRSGRGT